MIRYLSETYKSSHGEFFKKPPKPNINEFGKGYFVGEEISDSAFTRNKPLLISDNKTSFGVSKNLDPPSKPWVTLYDKSKIVPCQSAFTNDACHIVTLGNSLNSPFEVYDI
jgi:hypothetical protein